METEPELWMDVDEKSRLGAQRHVPRSGELREAKQSGVRPVAQPLLESGYRDWSSL